MNWVHRNETMLTGPQAVKGFVFVAADARGQPVPEDRRLVRSHVMRGKNTRTRAPRNRLKGRVPAVAMESQQLLHSAEESHKARTQHELLNSNVDTLARIRHSGMVPRAANVFTFIKFPEDIDSSSRSMLCTCTSPLFKREQAFPLTPSLFQTFCI